MSSIFIFLAKNYSSVMLHDMFTVRSWFVWIELRRVVWCCCFSYGYCAFVYFFNWANLIAFLCCFMTCNVRSLNFFFFTWANNFTLLCCCRSFRRQHKFLNICFWMNVSQKKKINVVKYLKKEIKNSKDLKIILKNWRCRRIRGINFNNIFKKKT